MCIRDSLRHTRPRAEVHLVDRHGTVEPRAEFAPLLDPLLVAPDIARGVVNDGRGLRRLFERHAEGVAFLQQLTGRRPNLELVPLAVLEIGNEQFPDTRHHEQPHGMNAPVPLVEVADDADALGVGSPHGEVDAGSRANRDPVRTKLLERPMVGAFAEQWQSKSVSTRPYRYG